MDKETLKISTKLKKSLRTINDPVSKDLLASTATDKGNYLGTRKGFLTYVPANKLKDIEKPYAVNNRVRGKPAKVARRFCTTHHSDAEYERFHNSFYALNFNVKSLQIIKGDDIVKVYNDWYDRRPSSYGVTSCMTGAGAYRFELYTKFPKKVRMLVMWDTTDDGKKVVIGRAVLWSTNKGIYLDRIYGSDVAQKFMRNYADRHGWMRHLGYNEPYDEAWKSTEVEVDLGDVARPSNPPYLDTFAYGRGASRKRYASDYVKPNRDHLVLTASVSCRR